MPTQLVEAISLQARPLGEADRLVVLLTRERGVVRAVARGALKPTSALAGRTEPLVRSRVLLATGRRLDTITQVEALDHYAGVRGDWTRLVTGLYLAELLEVLLPEGGVALEAYDGLVAGLTALSAGAEPALVGCWFTLRMLDEVGHRPQLDACVRCLAPMPAEGPAGYAVELGGALCPGCRAGGARVPAEALARLARLQDAPPSALAGSDVPGPGSLRLLGRCAATVAEAPLRTLASLGLA